MAVQGFEEKIGKFKLQGFSLGRHMASLLPYSFGQHKSGPFQNQGRKLDYSMSGSRGKAPLQRAHSMPSFGNNWHKEKETLYGRTGDVGKSHQIRQSDS